MHDSVGLQALAIAVPDHVVTNDHWRQTQPELVARAEERIWMWKKPASLQEGGSEAFNVEMAPFLGDPFRGVVERRRLAPEEKVLPLEVDAAQRALDAAGLDPEAIDLLLCTSFLPDEPGIGGAAHLARALGLRGAAWNLESACSSSNIALHTACSLVRAGQHRRVLVVTSCAYSKVAPDSDPISWGVGDAAAAMIVAETRTGIGMLGSHSIHSGNTCGAVAYHFDLDSEGQPYLHMQTGRTASKLLRETSEPHLKICTENALRKAGVSLSEIDFCVFNTPLAWYAPFCARALGIDPAKTINMYPMYANVGPCLLGVNLFHAAHWRLSPDDLVLIYTVGSVSSCAASVVRWGDVALGELPAGCSIDDYQRVTSTFPQVSPTFAAAA
ncbi:MAG: beta-ketoacyl synthase N-terminal-like domain-containing protein [Acidobacteriota bacterium]